MHFLVSRYQWLMLLPVRLSLSQESLRCTAMHIVHLVDDPAH